MLPTSPGASVIEWRTSGGLAGSDGDGPDVVVRADGGVTVAGRLAGGRPVEGRITSERLQELLRLVLDEHRFFEIDAADVRRRVEAARDEAERPAGAGDAIVLPAGPPFADAGVTHLAATADGRHHAVDVHGLFAAAREFPDVEELAHLRAIELALIDLADEVRRGAA